MNCLTTRKQLTPANVANVKTQAYDITHNENTGPDESIDVRFLPCGSRIERNTVLNLRLTNNTQITRRLAEA